MLCLGEATSVYGMISVAKMIECGPRREESLLKWDMWLNDLEVLSKCKKLNAEKDLLNLLTSIEKMIRSLGHEDSLPFCSDLSGALHSLYTSSTTAMLTSGKVT
jgi:hypothetical protein